MQFGDALLANLTYTLAGKAHIVTKLLDNTLLAANAEALLDNLEFAILQYVAQYIIQIGCERLVIHQLIGTGILATAQHVGH